MLEKKFYLCYGYYYKNDMLCVSTFSNKIEIKMKATLFDKL